MCYAIHTLPHPPLVLDLYFPLLYPGRRAVQLRVVAKVECLGDTQFTEVDRIGTMLANVTGNEKVDILLLRPEASQLSPISQPDVSRTISKVLA